MTREEAIFCEKSYIGETNCTDCKYYGTETCKSRESHRMAIKALEQEILDKIRAEIDEQYDRVHPYDISCAEGLEMVLEIIDKYRTESEG